MDNCKGYIVYGMFTDTEGCSAPFCDNVIWDTREQAEQRVGDNIAEDVDQLTDVGFEPVVNDEDFIVTTPDEDIMIEYFITEVY